jgi:PadR family transcriptional regulator, regulatory protein PadR
MREWVSEMRRGILELCLLEMLRGGESYGYQIVQRLGTIEVLSVNESTVYPILSRLQRDGYLRVRLGPSPGGPPRRYFSLTAAGRQYAVDMGAYWEALGQAVSELRGQGKEGAS